jgi:hypothetical protein
VLANLDRPGGTADKPTSLRPTDGGRLGHHRFGSCARRTEVAGLLPRKT